MKQREHFFCAKKTKQRFYSTLFSSAILENISAGRKQRTLFCVNHIPDMLFSFKSKSKYTYKTYSCGMADSTEERTLVALNTLKWRYAEPEETNCWIKSWVFFAQKKCSRHFIKVRLNHWTTADRLFWQCLSYFSRPLQCYLLGSQWDSHTPPGFHPQYLKLCSEDEQSFYGFGMTWG